MLPFQNFTRDEERGRDSEKNREERGDVRRDTDLFDEYVNTDGRHGKIDDLRQRELKKLFERRLHLERDVTVQEKRGDHAQQKCGHMCAFISKSKYVMA